MSWVQKITGLVGPRHVDRDDIAFMPSVDAAAHEAGARLAYILSLATLASVVIFLVWAGLSPIDEVTRGTGRIIPASKIQLVQSLEGGVVTAIMVKEGQTVKPNDILLKIDPLDAQTALREHEARHYYLRAMQVRLGAEVAGKEPVFPDDLRKNALDNVMEQIKQFNARADALESERAILKSQEAQRRQELRETSARLRQLGDNLKLREQELAIRAPLVDSGAMSKVELLRIQGEVTNLRGEIATLKTSIPRIQAAILEATQRDAEIVARFRSKAQDELAAAKAEADGVRETLVSDTGRVKRTELRAPVAGIVKQLAFNTVGGVVKPGETIMEIVPLHDVLRIEARIAPKDVAFIHPGQRAVAKITAYDYAVYGGLDGVVDDISADAIADERGDLFYRVTMRTEKSTLHHDGRELPLIPGMLADIQILTGKKTILDYMLNPVTRARANALRER